MAIQYRDIGRLGTGYDPSPVPVDTVRHTDVYKATHDGTVRLPYMQRAFISFQYGGRHIEDFNVLAYTDGDRLQREAYAQFDDLTSSYDTIPGQFYWGTYYRNNSLSVSLATDGMTQRDLDDFKYWFRAGSVRELILAEHPNRAIMARVANPPQLHLLPFEHEITVPFSTADVGGYDTQITTSTTAYKGEISLELVMDEPFWYAKQNILGMQDPVQGYYTENWVDANGRVVPIRTSKDALKIVYEDHIPLGSTVKLSVFLGDDVYASVQYEMWSQIVARSDVETYTEAQQSSSAQVRSAYFRQTLTDSEGQHDYWQGARICQQSGIDYIGGKIGGAQLSGTSSPTNGINLSSSGTAYLYYAGTAPSPVTLRFDIAPDFNDNGYIISPASKRHGENLEYNTITLESSFKHEFKFTLPTFWSSYNQALEIFDNPNIIADGNAWLTLRETIRDTIRHPIIRQMTNKIIDAFDAPQNGIILNSSGARLTLKWLLQKLFIGDGGEAFTSSFTFNGKTGEAIGELSYRDLNSMNIVYNAETYETTFSSSLDNQTILTSVENVGDMVKSSYLILDERNVLSDKMQVQGWTEEHPDYAYKITHDLSSGMSLGLQNLHFEFKNMYL